ncbi:MAG: hypothetical protein PHW53_04975 [Patescibacteria group bacterium]|nr:hypothetical protein [Patescibacteria group bacterium]
MAEYSPNILTYDITAYLGDTLNLAVTWKDADSVPLNFTGCTGLAQIKLAKADADAVGSFTVVLGSSTNNIAFSLSAAQVLALGVGKWFYDLQVTFADGSKRTFITGRLKTIQDVTRP